MNLRQLKTICAVVEYGFNLSYTAELLNMSQPAISKQIMSLESEMTSRLFVRSKGRLVAMTPVGERVYQAARSALGAIAEITSIRGGELEGETGKLVICASRARARHSLASIIKTFLQKHPDVEVSVMHGNLQQMTDAVIEGTAAFAITIEHGYESERIVSLPFEQIERVVVVPAGHRLLKVAKPTLKDLASYAFVMYDETHSFRQELVEQFRRARLTPKIAVSASDAEVIKAYVLHGMGIAVLAKSAFNAAQDVGLTAIPVSHLFPPAVGRIIVAKHHFMRKVECDFIRLLAPEWSRSRIMAILGAAQ